MKRTIQLLLLLAIAFCVAAPWLWSSLQQRRQRTTRLRMKEVGAALALYYDDQRRLPDVETIDRLRAVLEPRYVRRLPTTDGWGNEFRYRWWGTSAERLDFGYDIVSPGADGRLAPETERLLAIPHSDPEARGVASMAMQDVALGRRASPMPWFDHLDDDIIYDGAFIHDQPTPLDAPGTAPRSVTAAAIGGAALCAFALAAITISHRQKRGEKA